MNPGKSVGSAEAPDGLRNRCLRDVRIRIDLKALERDGYKIPPITRVGRHYKMPGGGYEMEFPYQIKPKYFTVIRP